MPHGWVAPGAVHFKQQGKGACAPSQPIHGCTYCSRWGSQGGTRQATRLLALIPCAIPVHSCPAHIPCSTLLLNSHLPIRPPIPAERRGSMSHHSIPHEVAAVAAFTEPRAACLWPQLSSCSSPLAPSTETLTASSLIGSESVKAVALCYPSRRLGGGNAWMRSWHMSAAI